jgi:hypothetical protein
MFPDERLIVKLVTVDGDAPRAITLHTTNRNLRLLAGKTGA